MNVISDELLDALGEVYVSMNIGFFRKLTFSQFVEVVQSDPRVLKFIQIKGN